MPLSTWGMDIVLILQVLISINFITTVTGVQDCVCCNPSVSGQSHWDGKGSMLRLGNGRRRGECTTQHSQITCVGTPLNGADLLDCSSCPSLLLSLLVVTANAPSLGLNLIPWNLWQGMRCWQLDKPFPTYAEFWKDWVHKEEQRR